jgi:protein-tyrosine phosphatase
VIDLHFVTPELAVGASFPRGAAARLAGEHRIARVVDVRLEERDDETELRAHGMRLLHLPTEDCCAITPRRLREGVVFASEGIERGERVFIHCQYGIGRSALLSLCVLVARGVAPLQAMTLLKTARSVVSPSPEQLEAFVRYCRDVRNGSAWAVPTVPALAEIAWRHLRRAGEVDEETARAGSTRR